MPTTNTLRIVNFPNPLLAPLNQQVVVVKPPFAPAWPWLTQSFFVQAAAPAQSAPAPQTTPQDPPPTPALSWDELTPYLARHIGVRQPTPKNWSFDIGGNFGPLPAGADPKIDAIVQQALLELSGLLGSLFIPFLGRELFGGLPENLTPEEKRLEVSRRLWVTVQGNPQILSAVKIQLARALEGKLQIKDLVLTDRQASLSKKTFVTWTEVLPYVRGALLLETRPTEQDGQSIDQLVRYICMTNNNMSTQVPAEQIDGKIMNTVVLAMIEEDQREGSLFAERLQRAIHDAREAVHFEEARPVKPAGMTDEAFTAQVRAQRAAEISKMTALVYEKLSGDLVWKFTTLGFLNAAFERDKLPPIVLP